MEEAIVNWILANAFQVAEPTTNMLEMEMRFFSTLTDFNGLKKQIMQIPYHHAQAILSKCPGFEEQLWNKSTDFIVTIKSDECQPVQQQQRQQTQKRIRIEEYSAGYSISKVPSVSIISKKKQNRFEHKLLSHVFVDGVRVDASLEMNCVDPISLEIKESIQEVCRKNVGVHQHSEMMSQICMIICLTTNIQIIRKKETQTITLGGVWDVVLSRVHTFQSISEMEEFESDVHNSQENMKLMGKSTMMESQHCAAFSSCPCAIHTYDLEIELTQNALAQICKFQEMKDGSEFLEFKTHMISTLAQFLQRYVFSNNS